MAKSLHLLGHSLNWSESVLFLFEPGVDAAGAKDGATFIAVLGHLGDAGADGTVEVVCLVVSEAVFVEA